MYEFTEPLPYHYNKQQALFALAHGKTMWSRLEVSFYNWKEGEQHVTPDKCSVLGRKGEVKVVSTGGVVFFLLLFCSIYIKDTSDATTFSI